MRNIILAVAAVLAVVLIILSFKNSHTYTMSNKKEDIVKKDLEPKKRDVKIVYINKKKSQNIKTEQKTNKKENSKLSEEQQEIVSKINSGQYVPESRIYKTEGGEYEAKVYIPQNQEDESSRMLPPPVPKIIEIPTPSGIPMPIAITKRVHGSDIIVEFKNKNNGSKEYKRVDINSNQNNGIQAPSLPSSN